MLRPTLGNAAGIPLGGALGPSVGAGVVLALGRLALGGALGLVHGVELR